MRKQWYMLAYDIRDEKRLKRLHYVIRKEAIAMQQSVFLIHADQQQLQKIRTLVDKNTHTQQDDVRLYPLTHPDSMWMAGTQQRALDGIFTAKPTRKKREKGLLRLIGRLFKHE
jgi:CRISPR-associated protein Cas2